MTTSGLEDRLRALAAKGELTHISLTPRHDGKKFLGWAASYAPATGWGPGFALDADPVTAILMAIESWKPARKPRAKKGLPDEDPLPDPTA